MSHFNKKIIFISLSKTISIIVELLIFSNKSANHKINRLNKKGLTALLNDKTSTFKEMLSKSTDTTIHVKNVQKMMTEV